MECYDKHVSCLFLLFYILAQRDYEKQRDGNMKIKDSMPNKIMNALLISFLFFSATSFSQTDVYPGTWEMEYLPNEGLPGIHIELKIANPEKNILYPAQLKLQCDRFTATYQLLLVKKNKNQLGISRNKYPVSEEPFSLGGWTIFLNNIFNYIKNNKGASILSSQRLISKRYGATLPDIMNYEEADRSTAVLLRNFLQNADINLIKVNPYPWRDEFAKGILDPSASVNYFGIMDTVHLKTNTVKLIFPYNKKNDNDTVSVMLNGKDIAWEIDMRRKNPTEEIELDQGLNILSFFADNYGKLPPNTGKLNLVSGKKKMLMDFNNKADIAATFIVAKLYYYPGNEDSVEIANSRINKFAERTLQRAIKPVGQIDTKSEQITLALWDDAVEDGDSISLNINGKWLVQGFAVRKQTQFLNVTLEPGPNQIIFIADNLGSISPNTSVLEIIDGKRRKSFKIDTNLNQNNLITIFYDFNPER